jgi:hypothetical protein
MIGDRPVLAPEITGQAPSEDRKRKSVPSGRLEAFAGHAKMSEKCAEGMRSLCSSPGWQHSEKFWGIF